MTDPAPRRVLLNPVTGIVPQVVMDTHSPERDLVSGKLHTERCWEPFESQLWLASQRAGDVVVDVGANLGYFSILSALHERAAAQIYAFEPASDSFDLLRRNLHLNQCEDAVTAVRAALSDSMTTGQLHRSTDNFGDHQVYAGDGVRDHEAIQLLEGAAFLRDQVDRIDLLKVDTQGSEHAVINGLLPLLRRSTPQLRVLIELTPYSLRLAGSSGRALVTQLAELGLPLAIVDHVEHQLVSCDGEALCVWADNVMAGEADRGFMNIFVGEAPVGI